MANPVHYNENGFPPENLDVASLLPLVGEASRALGSFADLLDTTPDPEMLLAPLELIEAVRSSRIEGINSDAVQTMMIRALRGRGYSEHERGDAEEVLNCMDALRIAAEGMGSSRTLTPEVLCNTHAALMRGERGRDKQPGQFRTIQNWIGNPRLGPFDQDSYFPPPPERVRGLMERLLNFVNNQVSGDFDPLIAIALAHAEFEGIHPFVDGNGRTGRMLVPLMARNSKLLGKPALFLSLYLDGYRREYYSGLRGISAKEAWTDWCVYFLEGIRDQADYARHAIAQLHDLRTWLAGPVANMSPKHHMRVIGFLFSSPVFRVSDMADATGISKASCRRIADQLYNAQITEAHENGNGAKPDLYLFRELMWQLGNWDVDPSRLHTFTVFVRPDLHAPGK